VLENDFAQTRFLVNFHWLLMWNFLGDFGWFFESKFLGVFRFFLSGFFRPQVTPPDAADGDSVVFYKR